MEADGVPMCSYEPGSSTAIATRTLWLLLDTEVWSTAAQLCWAAAVEGDGAEAVLEALVEQGIRSAPAFCLVAESDGGRRLFVRGRVVAVVRDAGRATAVSQPDARLWAETLVSNTSEISISWSERDGDGPSLPIGHGMVAAQRLVVASVPSVARTPATPVSDAVAPEPSMTPHHPVEDRAEPDTSDRAIPLAHWSVADVANAAKDEPVDAQAASADQIAPDRPHRIAQLLDPSFTTSRSDVTTDAVSNATLAPDDPEFPPRPPADEPGFARASGSATPTSSATSAAPTPEPDHAPVGLISSLPWHNEDDSVPTRAAAGHTVTRSSLGGSTSAGRPTVLAARCTRGHLSPAHASRCRICGTDVPGQEAFEVERPVLGVLVLSTGDRVSLDRDVVLGREPDQAQGPAASRPHTIALAEQFEGVSRNHVRVSLDGWHVLVSDLGSTNGTLVTAPNSEPKRLIPNAETQIEPGALIELADGVSFRYEAPA